MSAFPDVLELALFDFGAVYARDPKAACQMAERLLADPVAVICRIAWNDVRRSNATTQFPDWSFTNGSPALRLEEIAGDLYSAISAGNVDPRQLEGLLNDCEAIRNAYRAMKAATDEVSSTERVQRQPVIQSILASVRRWLPAEWPIWEPRLTAWSLALPDLLGIVDAEDSFDLLNPAGIVITRVTGDRPLAWRLPALAGREKSYLHPLTSAASEAELDNRVQLAKEDDHWQVCIDAPKLPLNTGPLRYLVSDHPEPKNYSTRWAEFIDVRPVGTNPAEAVRPTEPLGSAIELASRDCFAEAWGTCLESTNDDTFRSRIRLSLNVYDIFHRQSEFVSRELSNDATYSELSSGFFRKGDLERLTVQRIAERKADILGRFPEQPGFGGWGEPDLNCD